MKKLFLFILLLTLGVKSFGFPYKVNTANVNASEVTTSWTNFIWSMNAGSDQSFVFHTDQQGITKVVLRFGITAGSTSYPLEWQTMDISLTPTGSIFQGYLSRTNLPPDRTYYAEFAGFIGANLTDAGMILGRGRINIQSSLFTDENYTDQIVIQSVTGRDTEIDPVYLLDKPSLIDSIDEAPTKWSSEPATQSPDFARQYARNMGGIVFDSAPVEDLQQYMMQWDSDRSTLNVGLGEEIKLDVGQQLFLFAKNIEGNTINKGEVVYVAGASGDNPTIKRASNASEASSSRTIGIAAQNIANNNNGFVVTAGTIYNIDTSGFSQGAELYLGANGTLQTSLPDAPLHGVFIGTVERVGENNGQIFIHVQNYQELDELSDVNVNGRQVNDLLLWNGTVWTNATQSQIVGNYLPLTGGTISGNLDMGQNGIDNVSGLQWNQGASEIDLEGGVFSGLWQFAQEPTIPGYLTSAEAAAAYLPIAGGTMSGNINMADQSLISQGRGIDFDTGQFTGAWNFNSQPDITGYLTSAGAAATYLPLSGGTMSGNLDMNQADIVNVAEVGPFSGGSFIMSFETGEIDGEWEFSQQPIIPGYISVNNLSTIAGSGLSVQDDKLVVTADVATPSDLSSYLLLAGGTMSGDLTIGNNSELILGGDGSDGILLNSQSSSSSDSKPIKFVDVNEFGQSTTRTLTSDNSEGRLKLNALGNDEYLAYLSDVVAASDDVLAASVWASADSTTNYASRLVFESTTNHLNSRINTLQTDVDSALSVAQTVGLIESAVVVLDQDVNARLESSVWAAADSTTNYALRTTFISTTNSLHTNVNARLNSNFWASADSTTNYARRTGEAFTGIVTLNETASTSLAPNHALRLKHRSLTATELNTDIVATTGGLSRTTTGSGAATIWDSLNLANPIVNNQTDVTLQGTFTGDGSGLSGLTASATNAVSTITLTSVASNDVTFVGAGITQTDNTFNWDGYMSLYGSGSFSSLLIDESADGATAFGVFLVPNFINEFSYGAQQRGWFGNVQSEIGKYATGASQVGAIFGEAKIGFAAYGAHQIGHLDVGYFATNNAAGAIQLMGGSGNYYTSDTGVGSILLGPGTNIMPYSVKAAGGFYGSAAGLTNFPEEVVTTNDLATYAKLTDLPRVNVFTPVLSTSASGTWVIDITTNAPVVIYGQIGDITDVTFNVDSSDDVAIAEVILVASANLLEWPSSINWAGGNLPPIPDVGKYNRYYFEVWRGDVHGVYLGSTDY